MARMEARQRFRRAAEWLVAPLILIAVAAAALVAALGAPALFTWIGLAALAALGGWILVTVLWPSRADRACPECRAEALERADAATASGLRCARCGWNDASASGWLLAEEEGAALEELALAERRRRPNGSR
jgi:ribosomal protein L37AE/L43A